MAVLFADGNAVWQRVLFIAFVVIAIAAFVILLGAGLRGLISWLRAGGRGRDSSEVRPAVTSLDKAPDGPRIWVQENVVRGQGQVFGAQGGNVIVHQDGPARPPSPAAPAGEAGRAASQERSGQES
jgi:hypothetical protein